MRELKALPFLPTLKPAKKLSAIFSLSTGRFFFNKFSSFHVYLLTYRNEIFFIYITSEKRAKKDRMKNKFTIN